MSKDAPHQNIIVEQQSLTYGQYLGLEKVLDAQKPLSDPAHHDEMLFIVQHQVAELWLKLVLHELDGAVVYLREHNLAACFKVLSRVKQIQQQLIAQWAVLETLTPAEYIQFRSVLSTASGFQSPNYREVEFVLGNKDERFISMFGADSKDGKKLTQRLNTRSIYDEFLAFLKRLDYAVPEYCIERDWSKPYQAQRDLTLLFKTFYQEPEKHWDAYNMCEKLVDIDENMSLWRFRHMKTVERIIGNKVGTGGSSGVEFLKKAVDIRLFPELIDVRTEI